MSRTSFLLFAALINSISLGDCKPTESRNYQFNIDSASRSDERFSDDFLRPEGMDERSSGKVAIHDSCIGNCIEKKPDVLNEGKQICPYEDKQSCLIYSLSKIAKVQVAALNRASADRNLKLDNFNKNSESYEELREEDSRVKFLTQNGGENLKNFSRKQVTSTNVHCRATRDVYIPEIDQNLPAFACKWRNNTFILSSERFLQDRRLYLEIKIDENGFQNMKLSRETSIVGKHNALPALLVLNAVTNDYRVEMHNAISGDSNIIGTAKDR